MSILDISKTLMYDFHYNIMTKSFKDIDLMYTDTDSLVYHIKNEDPYEFMRKNPHLFDTSDYKNNNEYGITPQNKKVIGKMKDENNGGVMCEFVGLRSKMYADSVYNSKSREKEENKKLKGIKKYVVEKIKLEDYKKCLSNDAKKYFQQNSIRSFKHDLYTITQNKLGLCPKDDKRLICDNNIDTWAYGHHKTLR